MEDRSAIRSREHRQRLLECIARDHACRDDDSMLAEDDSSVNWNSEDEEWADPRYEAWRELDGVEVMHGMQPNNVVFTKNELWRCKNQLAAAALYIEELESEIAEANLSAADTPKRAKGKRSGRAATKDDRRTGRAEHIGVCMPGTTFSTTKGHESASPESNIDSVDEPHALSLLGNHSMAADLMPHLDNNGHRQRERERERFVVQRDGRRQPSSLR